MRDRRPEQQPGINRTDAIRLSMKEGIEYTAIELAQLSNVPCKRVSALLKHDIEAGRIIKKNDEGPVTYRVATHQEQIAQRIESAISLLRRSGYTVVPPDSRSGDRHASH